jgi:hypothetical protein
MVWRYRPYVYTRGFANYERFIDHFDRRRSRFGLNSELDFAVWADTFCGGPKDADTDECIRPYDQARIRFHNVTGLVGIVRADNVIRTCFPPSKRRQYFEDECAKTVAPTI